MTLIFGLYQILKLVINVYSLICLINFLLRLTKISESNQIAMIVFALTDTPSQWLKRNFPGIVIQKNGNDLDLSPLILLLISVCVGIFLPYLMLSLLRIL